MEPTPFRPPRRCSSLDPGEFVLGLFGTGGKTTAFMVVNRNYRYGATATLKVALPGNRIHELDRNTGQWSDGEQLSADRTLKVELGPGDGRMFRVVHLLKHLDHSGSVGL